MTERKNGMKHREKAFAALARRMAAALALALAAAALLTGTLIYVLNSANELLNFIPEEKIAESRFWKPLLALVQNVFPYLKSLF